MMATVSTFSSPSWPNPNPNNPSTTTTITQPEEEDNDSPTTLSVDLNSLSPIRTNPNYHQINNIPNFQNPNSSPSLYHISFNQDNGCFACGINQGFRIYNCDPFRQIFRRDFNNGGGIGIVEMLFRCNILILVGGGPNPQYPLNKVMIWDDHQGRCIGELSFRSEIETFVNPKGLCEVSQSVGCFVLVCLGLRKGEDGNVVATASNKGTLVRIFGTRDGTLLREVRRGADRAEIYSLSFSPTAEWLVVSSDKGTIHVFSVAGVDNPDHSSAGSPSSSPRALIKGVMPKYFSSVWSLAQFRLVEGCRYIAAFGHQKNTVVILGLDGSFYRCRFDPKTGGEMTQLEYHNFVKPDDCF
ncbi:hypothetical protein M8C21_029034 [Ambrosia artemisiifolia]|uniref:Uncharacterized protein n=1 Tax=Ambrosia artemisiifolia TaxID=4212 RepID=A0AAD5CWB4_AMBAR|nr:hypothetical protein M8C21_029034 [Ambrosia artemisiifolia]